MQKRVSDTPAARLAGAAGAKIRTVLSPARDRQRQPAAAGTGAALAQRGRAEQSQLAARAAASPVRAAEPSTRISLHATRDEARSSEKERGSRE